MEKWFDQDKNYILKQAQYGFKDQGVSNMVRVAVESYLQKNNPLGLVDDFVQELLDCVTKYGGRFLRLDESVQQWYELDASEARRKASQALRERDRDGGGGGGGAGANEGSDSPSGVGAGAFDASAALAMVHPKPEITTVPPPGGGGNNNNNNNINSRGFTPKEDSASLENLSLSEI